MTWVGKHGRPGEAIGNEHGMAPVPPRLFTALTKGLTGALRIVTASKPGINVKQNKNMEPLNLFFNKQNMVLFNSLPMEPM